MALFAELFSIIAPVLICAGIGYLWAKSGKAFDTDFVTNIVMYIGTPALIVATLLEKRPDMASFWGMIGAAFLVFVVCACAGLIFLKILGLSPRAYLPVMTFPNAGNLGLPLCLFAFGEEGLALAIVFFTVASVLQFTVGVWVAQGRVDFHQSFKTPLIYAAFLAVAFVVGEFEAPIWLRNTLSLIAGLTIPLMLLALGVSLARLAVDSFARSLKLSLFRLGGGFAIGLLVAELMGLEGSMRGVLILQSSLSPAVYNYLFAERFGKAGAEVAGVIVLSTLMAFLVLPATLAFLLQ